MAILTIKMLEKADACYSQIKIFEFYFGDKINITQKLCLEHKANFEFLWASVELLSFTTRNKIYLPKMQKFTDDKRFNYSFKYCTAIAFAKAYNSKENAEHRKWLRS